MLFSEAQQMVAYMSATWNTRLDDPQSVAVWIETLAAFTVPATRRAIGELREELDWMPTHAQYVARVRSVLRRTAAERGLSPAPDDVVPHECQLCGGTGWQEVDDANVYTSGGVKRCACKGPEDRRKAGVTHLDGCSCRVCHYGPDRAADIVAGRDGSQGVAVSSASDRLDAAGAMRSMRAGLKK